MKRFGVIGTAVLFTAFAFTAAARAQDHDKDAPDNHQDAKPEKQQPDHDKAAKPEHQDQGKQNDQKKEDQNKDQEKAAQHQDKDQEKAAKQQEHDQQKAEHDQQKQEDNNRKDAEKADKHDQNDDRHANDQRQVQQSPERRVSANDQKNVWQEHRAHSWQSEHRTWQQRGGYHGYRIPDDRFRGSFGEAHEFVIVNQPVVVVEGFPRFQVAGFWFALVDPLPEYWAPNWYQTDECYVDYSDGGYYLTDVRYPQVRVAVNVFVQ